MDNKESNGCQSYGIFWDIENCCIPQMERASNVVQNIKQFIADRYESKVGHKSEPCVFCCSCDTRLLDTRHVEALNRYGVDILHVNPNRVPNKVIADSKLMESIQKFVEHHSHKSPIFLITGDIDFAPTIRAAKRRGFDVILLFGQNTSQDLKNCATESHSYCQLINGGIDVIPNTTVPNNGNSMAPRIRIPHNRHSAQERPDVSAIGRQSSPPSVLTDAMRTVHQIESRNQPSNAKSNTIENDTEFDPKKLQTIQEITGVEKHIALRVLQFCSGDLQLAIDTIISE